MSLYQMSISGGIMILFVLLIRMLFLHKLPKRTFPVLWSLCLLRLIIPFSIPAAFSLYRTRSQYPIIERQAVPVPFSESPPPAEMPAVSGNTAAAVQQAQNLEGKLLSYLPVIWAVGMVICVLFFSAVYLRCQMQFRESLPVEKPFTKEWVEGHPLRRKIAIRQSGHISAPLTYGIWRPVILLPGHTDWKDQEKWMFILEHEYTHIRRFDTAMKLLYILTACVHWFNPLVWVMLMLVNRDMELACDETVVRALGENSKKDYANVLIGMEEEKSLPMPFSSGFGRQAVEERVVSVMRISERTRKSAMLGMISVLMMTIFVGLSSCTVKEKSQAEVFAEKMQQACGKNISEAVEILGIQESDLYLEHEGSDGNPHFCYSMSLADQIWGMEGDTESPLDITCTPDNIVNSIGYQLVDYTHTYDDAAFAYDMYKPMAEWLAKDMQGSAFYNHFLYRHTQLSEEAAPMLTRYPDRDAFVQAAEKMEEEYEKYPDFRFINGVEIWKTKEEGKICWLELRLTDTASAYNWGYFLEDIEIDRIP